MDRTGAIQDDPLYRLGWLDGDETREFRHDGTFRREHPAGLDRLRICPQRDHLSLMWKLARALPGPLTILYVLHTSRCDNALGRYQSPPLRFDDVNGFLAEFCEFLSNDGRHDLWVHSDAGDATLVWDRHNIIWAYGPLDLISEILRDQGLESGDGVELPCPHVHLYHHEYDDAEVKVLGNFRWTSSPLAPSDVQYSEQ